MSVWSSNARKLDSVFDTNGIPLNFAYSLNGRVVFPDSRLVAYDT